MGLITVEVPDAQIAFFKKLVAQLGFALQKPTAAKAQATHKRPLNKVQQDFVDAYREMIEADKGIGPPLTPAREFLAELRAEEAERNG